MTRHIAPAAALVLLIAAVASPAQAQEGPMACNGTRITGALQRADFNFDGHEDLFVTREVLAATAVADYWLWNGAKRCFEHHAGLSAIPNLAIVAANKTLNSHTNDGEAGLLYTTRDYRFEAGELVMTREVVQDSNGGAGTFLRTTRKRVDGMMKPVSTTTMTREEAEASLK